MIERTSYIEGTDWELSLLHHILLDNYAVMHAKRKYFILIFAILENTCYSKEELFLFASD